MSRGSSDNGQRYGVTHIPAWEQGNFEPTRSRRDSPVASSAGNSPTHPKDTTHDQRAEEYNDTKVQYAQRCARLMAPPEDTVTPIQIDTPLTAPPLGALQKHPAQIPQGPRSTPYPPKFVKPPSPILEKVSIPSTTTTTTATSSSASPQTPGPVVALPGTMSSRRERSRSRARVVAANRGTVQKKRPLIYRFKSKFKDMFSHTPPDESQLERIPDRHWADEDF